MIFIKDKNNLFDFNLFNKEKTIVIVVDESEFEKRVGKNKDGFYEIKLSESFPDFPFSLMDAITFNEEVGNLVFINIDYDVYLKAKEQYDSHNFNDKFKREHENKYLVHSTTIKNFKEIIKDNKLKSLNKLIEGRSGGFKEKAIGEILGDPKDLSNYIMFSEGSYSSEVVVASNLEGKLIQDLDFKYDPQIRLYFDTEKLANDGILIRDGAHLKVKEELDLNKYLLLKIDKETLGIENKISIREFTDTVTMRN